MLLCVPALMWLRMGEERGRVREERRRRETGGERRGEERARRRKGDKSVPTIPTFCSFVRPAVGGLSSPNEFEISLVKILLNTKIIKAN